MLGWLLACVPPSSDPRDGSSSGEGAGSSGSSSGAMTSTGPAAATFGMDGAEGSEVGFVPPADVGCGGGAPEHCALCDVREQSCIDGFKCAPWADDGGDAWNGTRCVEIPGAPALPGQLCSVDDAPASGFDDCAVGSMCWGEGAVQGQGVCVPFCAPEGERPECPAGTACMLDGVGVLALCLPVCDPLELDPCPAQESCRYFSASRAAFCVPDGGGRVLSPTIQCGSDQQACPAGEVCISAATFGGCGAPSCCTPWCDIADPESDALCDAERPGHVCVPLFDDEPAPPGYESLGLCAEPPRDPA